jgi:hypothetical protein
VGSNSLRLSRGFHRLAVFLAAIPLLVGGAWSYTVALGEANSAKALQAKLVCAQTALKNASPPDWGAMIDAAGADDDYIDLQKLRCSDWAGSATVREVHNARPPDAFSYAASFLPPLGVGLAITLAVSFTVYGIGRAIGWVIGGFAA